MRRRTSVFVEEAARHFQLASIGLIIADVNYSDTSITLAALIPDHYPPFNHAGTVMRHVRLPDVKRDASAMSKWKSWRSVDTTIKDHQLYICIVRVSAKCHPLCIIHLKSYNSLYYSEYDSVLIDKRLKGFSDAIAQNSTCTARNSIYAR